MYEQPVERDHEIRVDALSRRDDEGVFKVVVERDGQPLVEKDALPYMQPLLDKGHLGTA